MSDSIRLVVSDLDGTLVDRDKKLTDATIEAVRRLRAAGIHFTIISARPRSGMIPIADALDLDAPMGAFNGGTIFRRDGSVLCQHRIEAATVKAMFDLIGDVDVDRWLFADDHWYASTERGEHVEHERIASNQPPIVTNDFTGLYDRADKLTFVSDEPGVLTELHHRAAALSARATIAQSQAYYLDVTARCANKGDGITVLAEEIGVPLSASMAIGDQVNDLPMFERVAVSVAMGQASADVQSKASWVTATNDADGVAAVIGSLLADPEVAG